MIGEKRSKINYIFIDFLAIYFSVFLFYIIFVSKFYNFDGVACAIAVEMGDLKNLFHGNHLLYGFLGFLFDRAIRLLGYDGTTLTSLQLFNITLSALSCSIFYIILYEFTRQRIISLLVSFLTAFSFGYWFWASEAQVYPLAYIPMLLITLFGIRFEITKRFNTVCFLFLMALLGHIIHILFLPVLFFFILEESAYNKKTAVLKMINFGKYVFAGLFISYLIVIVTVIKPQSFNDFRIWLLGSAVLTPDKHFAWHGGFSASNILTLIKTNCTLFLPVFYEKINILPKLRSGFSFLIYASGFIFLVLILNFFYGIKRIWKEYRSIVLLCLVWLMPYLVLFVTWEPGTLVYSLTNIFPLWMLLMLSVISLRLKKQFKILFLIVFLGIFLLSNILNAMQGLADKNNNRVLMEADIIKKHTSQNSVVLVASGFYKLYLPYFADRHPFYVNWIEKDKTESLKSINNMLKDGRDIYILPEVLEVDYARKFIDKYFAIEKVILEKSLSLYKIKRN
ncbi:MAG: hypothetical protein ABII27_00435 [bacterium]